MDNDKYLDLKTEIVRLDQRLLNIEEKVADLKSDVADIKHEMVEFLARTHGCGTGDKIRPFAYDVIKLLVAGLIAIAGLKLGGGL